MKRLLAALMLTAGAAGALSLPVTLPLSDMTATLKRKQKALVAVTVRRALTLDVFVVTDGTGEALLNAAGVRHALKPGASVLVWARYWGKSERHPAYHEIEALEIAAMGTPEADRLAESKAGEAVPPPALPAPSTPGTGPAAPDPAGAEGRLRRLDDLKAKGLISDEEYENTRRRILDSL